MAQSFHSQSFQQTMAQSFHSQSFQQTMVQILTTDYGALISKDCGTNFIQHISFTNIQQTMTQFFITTFIQQTLFTDYDTVL